METANGDVLVIRTIRKTFLHWDCQWITFHGNQDFSERTKSTAATRLISESSTEIISNKCSVLNSCFGSDLCFSSIPWINPLLNIYNRNSLQLSDGKVRLIVVGPFSTATYSCITPKTQWISWVVLVKTEKERKILIYFFKKKNYSGCKDGHCKE